MKAVPCPKIVSTCNKSKGSLDLAETLVALYRIDVKTHHWYINVFWHFVDVAKVNPWTWYKRHSKQLGDDYMIPACQDEISTCPAETDFIPRLHMEIKFRPGKTGQFSSCYLIILDIICMHFLWIFLVSTYFTKLNIHRFPLI